VLVASILNATTSDLNPGDSRFVFRQERRLFWPVCFVFLSSVFTDRFSQNVLNKPLSLPQHCLHISRVLWVPSQLYSLSHSVVGNIRYWYRVVENIVTFKMCVSVLSWTFFYALSPFTCRSELLLGLRIFPLFSQKCFSLMSHALHPFVSQGFCNSWYR
jgi:hypothetical protein